MDTTALWSSLVAFLTRIPGEVWGALIAIGGVSLAAHFSRKEGGRERQFDMRRRVYLDGAEAIARANASVARMADLELPNTEIARIGNETIERLAKVQVVATVPTVRAIADYQVTINECMTELWPGRWALLARAGAIAALTEQIRTAIADRDRWLEQIKQANVRGMAVTDATSQGILQGLWAQYNIAEELRVKFTDQHRALLREQHREQLKFVEECLTKVQPLLTHLPAALTRARAELGLGQNEEQEFQRIMASTAERSAAAVRRLAAKARELADRQNPQDRTPAVEANKSGPGTSPKQ